MNSWLGPPPMGHGSMAASLAGGDAPAGLAAGADAPGASIPARQSASSLASFGSSGSLASQAGNSASYHPLQTSLWNAILERCAGAAIDRAAISSSVQGPGGGHAGDGGDHGPAALLSEREVRDARYDCVVHLVTAADGAAEFYSTANNAARHEDVDEARAVDRRIRQVWLGSPNFVVVHNPRNSRRKSFSKTSATKLARAVSAPPEAGGASADVDGHASGAHEGVERTAQEEELL